LLIPLVEAGYQIHLRKINAANYGVPQHRKRILAIGGLGWTPRFPEPTNSASGAPGTQRIASHLPSCPTVVEAIEDLPEPAQMPPGQPQGHYVRSLSEVDRERIVVLGPGQTMRDLPSEFHHNSYKRRANRRVRDGMPTERRGGAPAGLRRLRPDEPSKAITGGARAELIHPFHNRSLTVRECARLQTFPDNFVFCGTLSQQMQLIGNAVPPKLARAISNTLREDLENLPEYRGQGQLVSFVPTYSTGVSPSLQNTVNKVYARFGLAPQTETLPLWL
jgi:DNA (cytosine-5)-methyltransferase 1